MLVCGTDFISDLVSLPVTSPFSVTEGLLASSVSSGQKAMGTRDSMEEGAVRRQAHVTPIGSFEFPILRRTSIIFGRGHSVVRFLPVTQQVIPLLPVYYSSHLGLQGHCVVVLWCGSYCYLIFFFLEYQFVVS